MTSTTNSIEIFPVNSYVLVFPEAAQAKDLEHPLYAKVMKARSKNPKLCKVQTISVLESEHSGAIPSFEMFVDIGSIKAVTSTEALTSNMGHYLRASVAASCEDAIFFGQIVHHNFNDATFFVHSANGITEVSNSAFRLLNPVAAMFLFNASIPITEDINLDAVTHATSDFVATLLETETVLDDIPGFFLPFQIFLGDKHMEPTDDIHWIDPTSGYHHKCKVLHVLQWTHFIDGNREYPDTIVLADTFCGDPCLDTEEFPSDLLPGSYKSLPSQPPSPNGPSRTLIPPPRPL